MATALQLMHEKIRELRARFPQGRVRNGVKLRLAASLKRDGERDYQHVGWFTITNPTPTRRELAAIYEEVRGKAPNPFDHYQFVLHATRQECANFGEHTIIVSPLMHCL